MYAADDSQVNDALLQKTINSLQSEERKKRRDALTRLKTDFVKFEDATMARDEIFRAVVKCFCDQSEECRELAANLLLDILPYIPKTDQHLTCMLTILNKRLNASDLVESSEEVRFVLIQLLSEIVEMYAEYLSPYLNDVILILTKTIVDPYPKIKIESCTCAKKLATSIPEVFHMQSESLTKPIIQNFTHQHYRVRVSAIYAIGAVVRFGNNNSVKDAAGPLAERLFDQTQQVREAVIKVAGDWLINLPDRYSYFYKLIPLLLTGMNDEVPALQEVSWKLWENAGNQWLQENEEELKDKIDFLTSPVEHYPAHLRRPNLGCRTLVKKNLFKIAPALVRELEDWLIDVRIKASQLLCTLVHNVEADVAQYVEQLLLGMYRACNDEDSRVVSNMERAAELMGYFVPVNNYWQLIHPVMDDSCQQGHLRVLAFLMKGSKSSELNSFIAQIAEFLQEPSICRSRECVKQLQLVECCSSIIKVCESDSTKVSQSLFNILVTVMALSTRSDTAVKTEECLLHLQALENIDNPQDLYKKYMRVLLVDVTKSPETWTVNSPEPFIFQTLLIKSGSALGENLDVVVPALEVSLEPDNTDAGMKLKLMTCLAKILVDREEELQISANVLNPFLIAVVQKVIQPNLLWKAGRTAEAIRTITVSCLLAILQSHDFQDEQIIGEFLDSLLPLLLALVDDSAKKTRFYACCSLHKLIKMSQAKKCWDAELVSKTYFVVLKRLDDVADDVRKCALETLRTIFCHLPDNYNLECSSSHIETLYATLLVHLDDPEEEFRAIVLNVLKDLASLNPNFLLERLSIAQSNYCNQEACTDLIKFVQKINL